MRGMTSMSNQDPLILAVENWLNTNYSNHPSFDFKEPEGRPGNTVVGRLIMAMQIELGVSNPVPTFGPGTEAAFRNISKDRFNSSEERYNMIYILQGAFWAKGYSPGTFDGKFTPALESAIHRFQADVGFDQTTAVVDVKLMKALLNTDGFRLSAAGNPSFRIIQQILNTEYAQGYFDYIPTNGVYERQTNRALIYALQIETGLSSVANGAYGPSTIRNTPTLRPGNTQRSVNRIVQFGLAVNGFSIFVFDGSYGSVVEQAVREFQEFMTLPVTGIANMPTIKQLLTSNGYVERSAIASDASMIINESTAQTLLNNGYEIIGRYLTGTVGGSRSKAMTHEELAILQEKGIRVFPIYQDGGYYSTYFNRLQGYDDAREAIEVAQRLGFPDGTTIYFAVDFDAYDFQVSQLILPYMSAVREVFEANSSSLSMPNYEIGVYGPRNVCIRCMEEQSVHAKHSFVANMSTGFSGNLGFPMPRNWSFAQFFETSIGSGNGYLEIDKNDYSRRDTGTQSFLPILDERDETEQVLFEKWQEIVSTVPLLQSDVGLVSAGFEFNESIVIYDNLLLRVEVETTVDYTTPNEGNNIRIDVVNGEIQSNLETLFGDEYSILSSFGLGEVNDAINNLSASVDNGFIEVGVELVENDIQFRVGIYNEDVETPQGTVSFATEIILTLKTYFPDFSREQIEDLLLKVATGAGVIIAAVLIGKFVGIGVVVGGVATAGVAVLSYINGLFDDGNNDA